MSSLLVVGRRRSIKFYMTVSYVVAHCELCFLHPISPFSGKFEP